MGGFGGMPGIADRVNRPFNEDFRCYSMAMFPGAQRENVDYGGKGTCLLLTLLCLKKVTDDSNPSADGAG